MKKNKYTKKQLLDILALELYRINYGDTVLDLTSMLEGENPELAEEIYATVFSDEMKIKKKDLRRIISRVKLEKSGSYGPITTKCNCDVKGCEGSE